MLTQQNGCPLAGLGHVDVRVSAVSHQAVGHLQHARSDVGVQVQAGNDGHAGADHGADARDQFAFAVVGVFSHGCAVQVEVHAVQALHHGRSHVFQNGAANALKSILRHIR